MTRGKSQAPLPPKTTIYYNLTMKHLPLESRYYRECLKYYTRHLERVGYSRNTIKTLPSQVREFFHHLEQIGIRDLQGVTPGVIYTHYRYLKERPCRSRAGTLSDSMVHSHMWALRILFDLMLAEGSIESDPLSKLSFPTRARKEREVLNFAEIEKLYDVCISMTERVILGLLYGCGLRKSEAEALDGGDINPREKLLYVRSGKGKKRRVVPFTAAVAEDFNDYYHQERTLALRKSRHPREEKAFMLNRHGQRMSGLSMWRRFRQMTLRAGIENPGRITLHSLRHTIATHLLERGLSIEQVRDFLGHATIESTQVYTRVVLQRRGEGEKSVK